MRGPAAVKAFTGEEQTVYAGSTGTASRPQSPARGPLRCVNGPTGEDDLDAHPRASSRLDAALPSDDDEGGSVRA